MTAKRPFIGVFGGTFDPVHEGHLHFAASATKALGLDKLVFVPAAQNPLKTKLSSATGSQRLEMVKRALAEAGNPAFEIYDGELQRPAPSYTIDTIEALQKSRDADWILLMGSEVFRSLPSWKEPQRLLSKTEIAVVTRPGEAPADPNAVLGALAPDPTPLGIRTLEIAALPYSSTALRLALTSLSDTARAQDSSPLPGLQRAVWLFIKENQLYTVR